MTIEQSESCEGFLVLDDSTVLDDIGWYCGNSPDTPQPVGLKPPNAWGLYDIVGNVYEWTSDWSQILTDDPQTDPVGPVCGYSRIIRGGSHRVPPSEVRSAWKTSVAESHFSRLGIRLVRTVSH